MAIYDVRESHNCPRTFDTYFRFYHNELYLRGMCNFYRLDDLLGQLEEMGDLVMTGHHNGKHIMHPIISFPA